VEKSASPDPEGKAFDLPDPKRVGPGSTDPWTALSTSPDPKGTDLAPFDPRRGFSA
jgi:hypothetical protein